jgi:DNA-nicking Smr family endonuclease
MADVQPIARDRIAPEMHYRTPVTISQHERAVLRELDELVAGEGDVELADPDDTLQGAVPGLDPRVVKRLRKGEFTLQADLDLHGSDAQTARGLLERFLIDTHGRGLRCVRVVHGRGKNSPGGVPVLKANLPRWLARGPARHLVLAYTSATPQDGGAGATYVLLRRGRAQKRGKAR